ncbi:MAG: hypothetical protein J7M38_04095, partial [Armatimonadetes bacterium]|nr:hypothetical protein [Armatimonadota bacterium]
DFPLTYEDDTGRLAIDGRFSVVEFLRGLGEVLHPGGRVVFPNMSCSRRVAWYYFVSDVCGLEGRHHELPLLAFFRSMAHHKPALRLDYLEVMGHRTAISDAEGMEEYFRNCATYGVYPSIGRRCDEAYERYRDLFEAYMPALRAIGAAGWEPVTHARFEGAREVIVERFGPARGRLYLTVHNPGDQEVSGGLLVDAGALGVTGGKTARDLLSGETVQLDRMSLSAHQLMVLEMSTPDE